MAACGSSGAAKKYHGGNIGMASAMAASNISVAIRSAQSYRNIIGMATSGVAAA